MPCRSLDIFGKGPHWPCHWAASWSLFLFRSRQWGGGAIGRQMNYDPARKIVDGLLKPRALSVQICVLILRRVLAADHTINALPC